MYQTIAPKSGSRSATATQRVQIPSTRSAPPAASAAKVTYARGRDNGRDESSAARRMAAVHTSRSGRIVEVSAYYGSVCALPRVRRDSAETQGAKSPRSDLSDIAVLLCFALLRPSSDVQVWAK